MYEAIPVLAKVGGRIRALVVQQTFPRMLRWHDQKCTHSDYEQIEIEIQSARVRLKD